MNPGLEQRDVAVSGDRRHHRRVERIEVSVFLFLIVPSMAFSFFAVRQGTVGFTLVSLATILRDLSLVALILFFLWHNREKIGKIGWTLRRGWREVA